MIREVDKKRVLYSLKNYVNMINYPLSYKDDFCFYNKNFNFNCYAYAMGFKRLDNFKSLSNNGLSVYNPGTISNFDNIFYDEIKLIKAFLEDCYVLGIECKPTSIDSNISNDVSKIAIYIEPSDENIVRDFHFARLNSNGIWSNMNGAGGNVTILGDDNIENIPGYDFLGAYTLRKKK